MVVYNILPLKSYTNKAVKLKPGISLKNKKCWKIFVSKAYNWWLL